jgi:hypothetical protein
MISLWEVVVLGVGLALLLLAAGYALDRQWAADEACQYHYCAAPLDPPAEPAYKR